MICDGLNQNFLKSLDFCFDPTQATPPKGGRQLCKLLQAGGKLFFSDMSAMANTYNRGGEVYLKLIQPHDNQAFL